MDLRRSTLDLDFTCFNSMAEANEIGRPKGRPKRAVRARGMLMEVPAAAEVATAQAAHMPAAEAAHVAEVSAGEMTAAELAAAEAAHVADVSADEMSPVAVEMSPVAVESEATVEAVVEAVVKPVVEAAASDEDRTTKPVAIVVIRIGVSVTIVVARAIIRHIVIIAAVRIARRAGDHSCRDGRSRIVAVVGVAVAVSPNVAAMACVAMCDIPVNAMCDPRMGSVPVMVSDGRRICGRNRRR